MFLWDEFFVTYRHNVKRPASHRETQVPQADTTKWSYELFNHQATFSKTSREPKTQASDLIKVPWVLPSPQVRGKTVSVMLSSE